MNVKLRGRLGAVTLGLLGGVLAPSGRDGCSVFSAVLLSGDAAGSRDLCILSLQG